MTDLTKHYDHYYSGSDAEWLAEWRRLGGHGKAQNIRRLWHEATGESSVDFMVDIGCGDGAVADALAEAGFFDRCDGYDVSASGVERAKARGVAGARFATYSGGSLPVGDRAYSLAVLSHVVEHVEEPRTLIREAARIAKWVFIEVPLELNLRTRRNFEWTDVGHINLYNPTVIRHLVQSTGLEVVAETVVQPDYRAVQFSGSGRAGRWKVKQALLSISPALATRVFTYHGALIARSGDA